MGTRVSLTSAQLLVLIFLSTAHSDAGSELALICGQLNSSPSLPSSVHSLRPADVRVLSALGLSTSHRSAEIKILNGLSEILSRFNPGLATLIPEQRGFIEEVEDVVQSLSNDQWKLLLLFVSADELCVCPGQAALAVEATVRRVEDALNILHEKLDHTLVHVVVWGGRTDGRICECEEGVSADTQTWSRLERATIMANIQERLGALLQKHHQWTDGENFTVALQSSPTYFDSSDDSVESDSETLMQVWSKLLQPMGSEVEGPGIAVPCPTHEKPYLYTHRNSPVQPESETYSAEEQIEPLSTSFPCTVISPSPSVPTSVHLLRPADIKVVAALGDSLTAGYGAGSGQNDLLGVLTEYRGLSWSVGGDKDLSTVTTLANILRKFNPSLTGFSTGTGKATTTQAFLNQAVGGAKSKDLPSQAQALISRMKSDSRINFQNHWKVITVFIGGNDLCEYCTNLNLYSADNFAKNIRDALDILHREVPRALVNLVEIFNIAPLRQLHQDSTLGCPTWVVKNVCPCVVNPAEGSSELKALTDMNTAYQTATRNLVASGRYNTRSDFNVVLQPFFRKVYFPVLSNGRPDRSFFAGDCFHFSQKSHTLMARALWNNMLEPISSKTTSTNFNTGVTMKCPSTSNPYFSTNGKSLLKYVATPTTANWGSDFSCVHTAPSDTVPASVHRLRPGDINAVTALGHSITAGFGAEAKNTLLELLNEERGVSWRSAEIKILNGLSEILSRFNPGLATLIPEQRGFIEEVEDVVQSLSNDQWKLLLLFVSADELCVCPGQAALAVEATVRRVEDALNILHEKLDHTLVHVVVWGGRTDGRICECEEGVSADTQTWSRLERATIMANIQERLGALLQKHHQWTDGENFTVALQSSPTYFDSSDDSVESDSETLMQVWSKLLQPMGSEVEGPGIAVPCPTHEKPYLYTHRNSPVQPESETYSAEEQIEPLSTSFPCTVISPSPSVPTSVHLLRPADIKVVAALGDSLTAGYGAGSGQNDLLGVLTEYRGLSWSVGGDKDLSTVTTLANILRKFNPSLTGFSTGTGKATTTQAFLNQAVGGAKSKDLPSQAQALISRMKSDSRINFQNHWKVITVFIGGNDLCEYCTNLNLYSADNFAKNIRDALDILHREVPRALVNLVEIFNIAPLRQLHQDSTLGCPTWVVKNVCPCVVNPAEGSSELKALTDMNTAYQTATRNLVASGRYNTRSDFNVVLQPFFRKVYFPVLSDGRPDRSFFAGDCFHFSQKSHTLMARALWNNMLEPISSKTTSTNFNTGVTMKCPSTSNPYFSTNGKSLLKYVATPTTANWGSDFSCVHTAPSDTVPASVHRLRPGDINVVTALGHSITAGFGAEAKNTLLELLNEERGVSWRSAEIKILNGLSEILSRFNPGLATLIPEQRGFIEEVEDVVQSLSNDQWKLLLLFVSADELCVCPGQAALAVEATVRRVEDALNILHEKLDHTLVHVVVWGGRTDGRICECEEGVSADTQTWSRLERATIMANIQERLGALLQKHHQWTDGENFTVALQSSPTYFDSSDDSVESDSETLMQVWSKLLQPMGSEVEGPGIAVPCPTHEKPYLYTHRNSPVQPESETYSAEEQIEPLSTSFPCTVISPSPSVPTSVHLLRPADIKVVAALGDSLTAGYGAGSGQNDLLGVLTEYRGLSWSVGGDKDLSTVTTLANILRKFNPSLTGFSTGTGKATTTQAFLNQAVGGAKSKDLPSQAQALISRMKSDSRINFQNHWKVITVFIGGNDLCEYCTNLNLYSADNFAKNIRDALDILHQEVPRALVNLVEIFNIAPLRQLHQDSTLGCPTWVVKNVCPCVVNPAEGSSELKALTDMNTAYQTATRNLVASGRYNTRSDFNVVLQPFFRKVYFPVLSDGRPDRSFFAGDCFHFSQKSHTLMARALWNNMLEPISSKTTSTNFNTGVTMKCPSTSNPYFSTNGKSLLKYVATPTTANWGSDFSCVHTAPSDTVPASVHRLRPGDINVVTALGHSITAGFGAEAKNILELLNEERGVSWRSAEIKILNGLSEILSRFNPGLATLIPEQRGFIEEVEDVVQSLSNDQWKLLLLFVSADELCVCPGQAALAVEATVRRVEDALNILHEKLDHTLVHVVVWGGRTDGRICECEEGVSADTQTWSRLERATIMANIQERLGALLQKHHQWTDGENFTVALQSSPTYFDSSDDSVESDSETLMQVWSKLLQPMGSEVEGPGIAVPCPTHEKPYLYTHRNSPVQPESETYSAEEQIEPLSTSFPCTVISPSPSVPTSVHLLRPADIKVVAALGDSLTAGYGAGSGQNDLLGVLTEYRGLSWSVGGDKDLSTVTTLANILRKFNPSLTGFSTGTGKATTTQAFLNQAVGGAKSKDLPSQAQALISRMKSDSRINFQNHWKVITVFIGGNDLCEYCTNLNLYSADNFAKNIRDALDILHREVPRALVNLVEIFNIAPLRQLHQDSTLGCPTWVVKNVCPCVVNPAEGSSELKALTDMNTAYQTATRNLVASGRYNTRSDFNVVLQPFFRKVYFPVLSNGRPDRSFFAGDCFHFSQKSHTLMARALWNNMLEPISSKTTSTNFNTGVTMKCPSTSNPYFSTNGKSLLKYVATPTTANWGSDFSCVHTAPSDTVPASVHRLRPGDINAVTALGHSITAGFGAEAKNTLLELLNEERGVSWRSAEIKILNGLSEILSRFNPGLATLIPEQRGFIEEVEDVVQSLSNDQWKLLLLFVSADELCVCPGQAALAVEATVRRVEDALNILHEKLDHTLVHVVVWGGRTDGRICECEEGVSADTQTWSRLERATIMANIQERLAALLQKHHQWTDGENFTVALQSSPTYFDSSDDSVESDSETLMQVWSKLLQPMGSEVEGPGIAVPCPTHEKPYLYTHRNSPVQPESETYSAEEQIEPLSTSFPCTVISPSPSVPTSVHLLRPADIKVVAALGDSLTAGYGAGSGQNDLLGVLTEYRGLSWSVGGDKDLSTVTTLANILRKFNPSLTGFSTGTGKATTTQAFLNQAVGGAKSKDLPSQAQALISRMKSDSRINFQNHWKVITVFIGGNDLCEYCTNLNLYSADNFAKNIRDALDILHQEVPRALVNLVEIFNIAPLRQLHQDSTLGCPTWVVKNVCPCVVNPAEGSSELKALTDMNTAYQTATRNLVASGRYNTRSDFNVVLQPFFRKVYFPVLSDGRPDRSFFAGDCFHFSQKSHTLMARALWNNMLEPISSKTTSTNFNTGVTMKCPSTSNPYFSTNGKSLLKYVATPTTANWGSDFSCVHTAPSDTVPASVHRLRPGDINIVASLGDSITAGFGAKAKNILELLTEERGVSWSIGGDETLETVTTIPNILKKFNPNVFGFSQGPSKRPNGFNMAVSGAKAIDIPGQVRDLVDALKSSTSVDFERDWKLVTLFIGGNDLCQYCKNQTSLSPKKYIGYIKDALDILYREVPRVLVNFVEILQIEDLRKIKSNTTGCTLLQPNLCPCFLRPEENSAELVEMKRINRQIQTETEWLVFGGQYDGREDFAVVLQPFFQSTVVPMGEDRTPDLSFFSVDCFHFTERGHAEMAVALWNNMLEPVGSKQSYNNFTHDRSKLRCPSEDHPFIFTRVNSFNSEPIEPVPTSSLVSPQGSVAFWVTALLTIAGVLVGGVLVWLTLSCGKWSKKKSSDNLSSVQIQGCESKL